ncbi:MAG TPA: RNA polymerase sigma factor SigZ [Sphingobacteriaceae bacterium]
MEQHQPTICNSPTSDIGAIWSNFNAGLKAYICKKVNQQDHCQDILQEVFIKVIHNADRVREADNIRAYLHRMASNAVMDHYRSASKRLDHPTEMLESGEMIEHGMPDPVIELADCCLRSMIEALPASYREALILTELEGLTQKQLAAKLSISLSGAKSRVQRGREKLKEIILNCCKYEFDRYGNIIGCDSAP